jgi:hypothetical protein
MTFGTRCETKPRLAGIGWLLAVYSVCYVLSLLFSRECHQSKCDWTPGFGAFVVGVCTLSLALRRETLWSCEQGILTVDITSLVEQRELTIPASDIRDISIAPAKDHDGDDAFDVVATLWNGDQHAFNHRSLFEAKSMQRKLITALQL